MFDKIGDFGLHNDFIKGVFDPPNPYLAVTRLVLLNITNISKSLFDLMLALSLPRTLGGTLYILALKMT